MSSGAKVSRAVALPIAERVVAALRPAAERVEIAGSLRRGAAEVSDIEVVCVPRSRSVTLDLFGMLGTQCMVAEAVRDAGWRWRTETHPGAPRDWREARRFWALVVDGVALDLFAVRRPAQWGAILAIRTGPASFSRRIVTDCQFRGLRCRGGHLERAIDGATVATQEERDFFRECGVAWIEPEGRR